MALVSALSINSFHKVCLFWQILFVLLKISLKTWSNSLAVTLMTQPALDGSLWKWFISFITFNILFFGLFIVIVNLVLKKVLYMTINGVFLAFGNSWVATTSTNGLNYTFNCLSNQLSNIIKFKVPSVNLVSFMCL